MLITSAVVGYLKKHGKTVLLEALKKWLEEPSPRQPEGPAPAVFASIPPPGAPSPAAPGAQAVQGEPAALPVDLQLLQRDVELLRTRSDLVKTQEALRRLRKKLDEVTLARTRLQGQCETQRVSYDQLEEVQKSLRALRKSLDEAVLERTVLSGELEAQKAYNLQLKAEIERLHRGGEAHDLAPSTVHGGRAAGRRVERPFDRSADLQRDSSLGEADEVEADGRAARRGRDGDPHGHRVRR